MNLFRFGVATEANDFEETEQLDEIWIKNDKGQLIQLEDNYENNKE